MTRPPDVVYFPTSGGLLSLSFFTGPVHYLEAFVELRKKDDEFYVQFGYSLSATDKAIKEGSWLPGEMAYLH